MLVRRFLSLSLLATAAALPVHAGAQTAAAADVTRGTLDNGLRVVIIRDPLAPVVSVYDNYLVGANDTPPGFPGMAHAQEHMAFRGCEGIDADQTAGIFAELGGDGDADTQQNLTQYFETVPAADLGIALRVDSSCMRNIVDSQGEWTKERGAIEQEVAQDLSDPTYKAFTRVLQDVFPGAPYSHDALGTRPSFEKTTGPLLKKFYTNWYAPNNAILVIAGDVDPQAALRQVRDLYGSIPRRTLPARAPVHILPMKSDSFSLTSDEPYTIAYIAYRMPGSADRDFAAADILTDVLSSQRGDLYGLVPQGKALFAGFQFSETNPKASLALAIGAVPPTADPKAFIASARGILAAYGKNGVPAELVDAAKRSEIAQNQFHRNSVDDLASTWSEALADEGRNSPDDDIDAIRKVTVADVNSVLHRYVIGQPSIVATLVSKPSGAAVSSKGFGGAEQTTTPPTKPVVLPDWAQAQLAKITVPDSTLNPTDETLPNGIRLIVQPESATDTVTVVGNVRHNDDLETAPGKDGAHDVLDEMLKFGTTSLDRLAYQKALDDIAAQQSAGSNFSLHVLRANFDRGMQLLADNELHPALPAPVFPIIQKQTAAAVAGVLHSPDYLRERAITKALYPADDPSLRETTPATVSGLSLDDVKGYYTSVFRPDMTTIVVIGNITPADARASVTQWFGDWKAVGPKPQVDLASVPLSKPSSSLVPDSERVQDETTLVETIGVTRSDPDYYALQLGDHVLGGGFYATRLYRDLRQNAGLVYFVDNRFTVGRTRATYSVSYGSDPPNVSKAKTMIARDLRAMQTTDVSAGELQQAKAILLRQLPLAESSEDQVADGLVTRAQASLPLDEPHRAAEKYAALGASDIRAAFAKWVRPDDFVQIVQGPQPG